MRTFKCSRLWILRLTSIVVVNLSQLSMPTLARSALLASVLLVFTLLETWFTPAHAADGAQPDFQNGNTLDLALIAEEAGDYEQALIFYLKYLDNTTETENRSALLIRSSILKEALRFGDDPALPLLLDAMDAREARNFDHAISLLLQAVNEYPNSYLNDDSLYLIGYIALLDQFEYASAHHYLRELLVRFPESKYTDTALYSEAIAMEQLGNTEGAIAVFRSLRDRHTQFSVGLINRSWPRDNLLSRYWYDRADKRLALLRERAENAAVLLSRRQIDPGSSVLRVAVNVQGLDLVLLLQPSQVTGSTQQLNEKNEMLSDLGVEIFSGQVAGEPDSWARVTLVDDTITGVVESQGERYELDTDTMIGTIDYYRPQSRPAGDINIDLQDYVMHPPDQVSDASIFHRVAGKTSSVTRLAKIAIVVDSQYNSFYAGQGMSRALSAMNVADGIYRNKFNLALQVTSARSYTNKNEDPMNLGSVTLEQMLRNFRDFRMQNTENYQGASLVYLFSGNRNSDQAIGLAWIGAACRLDGFDVGVTTPSTFSDLLVTHELGHSLGAQHDSDTTCDSASNQLMWPRISSSTEQRFTQCSTIAIESGLDAWCYSDAMDVALEWQDAELPGVSLVVRNNDAKGTTSNTRLVLDRTGVDFDQLPDSCVDTDDGQIACGTGELVPGGSRNFHFTLAQLPQNSLSLLAEISPEGFADVITSNNSLQMNFIVASDGSTTVSAIEIDSEQVGEASGNTTFPQSTAANDTTSGGGGAMSRQVLGWLALLRATSSVLRFFGIRKALV